MSKLSAEELAAIETRANAATPGPWRPCLHLRSVEDDKSCPCGYRGGIWGSDQEHQVCEIGSGDEPMAAPRYERLQEITNANFIIAARTDIPVLLAHIRALEAEIAELRERYSVQYRVATRFNTRLMQCEQDLREERYRK